MIKFQMTPEMTSDISEIDHVTPISLFDVSNAADFKKAFNWKNTPLLLKQVHFHEGTRFVFIT